MVNASILQRNMTQVSVPFNELVEYTRVTLILLLILGYGFFTFFITTILNVFFKNPQLRDSARYVLFAYMLAYDTYYLYSGFYLMLASINELQVPVPLCFFLYCISSIVFNVTPYSLAAMAVEQYVAICHPLRHAELCTTYRAHVIITTICSFLTIPCVVELFVMLSSKTNIFKRYTACRQALLVVNPAQYIIRSVNLILCFSSVALVILVTYIKIMVVAHRISSGSSSASKAGKTVMLHAFQLLMCMASLLSNITESFQVKQVELLPIYNFVFFNCLPRFLSPVIYGFRDETLRKHIRISLIHMSHKFHGKTKEKVFILPQKAN